RPLQEPARRAARHHLTADRRRGQALRREIASLSVSTPASRMPEALRAEYGKLVTQAARTLTESLG
ncbi:hypothetical protein AB0J43_50375, partial [Nonomuraea fuscirosea]